MKFKNWLDRNWPSLIYYAIAIATFKHSSWGFATVLEGPEPTALQTLQFENSWELVAAASWYLFGGLMAVAVDVGMFFSARAVREQTLAQLLQTKGQPFKKRVTSFFETGPWMLWATFSVAAAMSGFTQVLYGVQHAAPMVITEGAQELASLQPDGWVYAILKSRVLLLPLMLPAFAVLYTIALKVNPATFMPGQQPAAGQPVVPQPARQDGGMGLREFARHMGQAPETIRKKALKGLIGSKDNRNQWVFTLEDAKTLAAPPPPPATTLAKSGDLEAD